MMKVLFIIKHMNLLLKNVLMFRFMHIHLMVYSIKTKIGTSMQIFYFTESGKKVKARK